MLQYHCLIFVCATAFAFLLILIQKLFFDSERVEAALMQSSIVLLFMAIDVSDISTLLHKQKSEVFLFHNFEVRFFWKFNSFNR